jgi:hypothetical protein
LSPAECTSGELQGAKASALQITPHAWAGGIE